MVRDLRVQDGRFPARLAKRWEPTPTACRKAVRCAAGGEKPKPPSHRVPRARDDVGAAALASVRRSCDTWGRAQSPPRQAQARVGGKAGKYTLIA